MKNIDRHIHLEGAISTETVWRIMTVIEEDTTKVQKEDFWNWVVFDEPYIPEKKIQRFSNINSIDDAKKIFLDGTIQERRRYLEYTGGITNTSIAHENTGFRHFMNRCYGIRAVLFRPGSPYYDTSISKKIMCLALRDISSQAEDQSISALHLRFKFDRLNCSLAAHYNMDFMKTVFAIASQIERDSGVGLRFYLPLRRNPTRQIRNANCEFSSDVYTWFDQRWLRPLSELSVQELDRIAGVDIVGNENHKDDTPADLKNNLCYINYFIKGLQKLKKEKIGGYSDKITVTAHVGENYGARVARGLEILENVVDDLDDLNFIIHGTILGRADETTFHRIVTKIKDKGIGVLASIYSNLHTGVIGKPSEYPAWRLATAGVQLFPSSDDPGASGITFSMEKRLLETIIGGKNVSQ
ncbi:MAG: hypothetical protein HOD37_17570 [Bacteroidetes bacterium]|nr:hypothetical protein [Bacteroidota bacterium]